jgi:hypothetical protein
MKFKDLIGHNIIYNDDYFDSHKLAEVKVIAVSPSGKRVKIEYANGFQGWHNIDNEYRHSMAEERILEDLGKDKNRRKTK